MILNEAETARPLAIMEANLLSGMRTGAVIGLSARYLRCRKARIGFLYGSGRAFRKGNKEDSA